MSKVVSLGGVDVSTEASPSIACINALEEMLEKAKSGEITGVIAVASSPSGNSEYFITGQVSCWSAIGGLEMAKHHLMAMENE